MIITISGNSCSGKSTIGKNLAKEIGYKYISIGELYRELHQLYTITDKQLDTYIQHKIQTEDNIIIEGRMTGIILQNIGKKEDTSILLDVDENKQIERYLLRNPGKNINEAYQSTVIRDYLDQKRLYEKYNKNILEHNYYDLIINTNNKNIKTIIDNIQHDIKVK